VERLPQSLRAAGLLASGQAVGLTVTILNPALDPGGVAAGRLADIIVGGLAPPTDGPRVPLPK
jgi:hypothetical protein